MHTEHYLITVNAAGLDQGVAEELAGPPEVGQKLVIIQSRQHTPQGMLASPAGDPMLCSRQAVRALVASTVAAVVLRANPLPQLCPGPEWCLPIHRDEAGHMGPPHQPRPVAAGA